MKAPTHHEAEKALIGSIAAISAVRPEDALRLVESCRLEAEDFGNAAHADVFRASLDFLRREVPLELFTLEAALRASTAVKESGGRRWLADLLMAPGQRVSVPHTAALVRDAGIRRRAVDVLQTAARRMLDTEITPDEALQGGARAFELLSSRTTPLETAQGDIFRLGEMLDAAQAGRRELVIPCGIRALDMAMGGLQPSVLTLIGALPGVGKSALLATILWNVARSGRRVGLFSLEDERIWVTKRWVSLVSGVPLFVLATRPLGALDANSVNACSAEVYETLKSVIIDDRPALTPDEVAATASDMILNRQCRVIIVDHLGEMRFSRSERYDLDVAEALAALRNVAKRHNVPVIVASHVRRRQGLGTEDAPSLTDFANSSAPERMARVALGLSKPNEDTLRVTVLKQTNGKSGFDIDLKMVPHAAMVSSTEVLSPGAANGGR